MSRVNAFFVAFAPLLGLNFGPSLAHAQEDKSASEACKHMIEKQQSGINHLIAAQLYKQAFLASFDSDWPKAEASSRCAALLETGKPQWNFEPLDLIK